MVLLSIQEGDRNAPDLPVDIRLVSPDYLALLRVSLVRGRYPTAADDEKAPDVVVVNRALARLLYPGEDPIGQLLPMGALGRIIVGVTGDIHHVAHPPPVAIVGVYGVMSYAVAERTRELGIRVALGERPRHIRARVLLEGLQLAALGSVLGAGAVWFVSRALRSLVFQVSVDDPWMVIGVAIVLTIVTILAADGPARRAGGVDPITAMRGR